MKKWISTVVFVIVGNAAILAQDAVKPYFATEELPDLINCLPAPPDTTGERYDYDVLRYMWGKAMRKDAERAAVAIQDAVWTYDALLATFAPSFGLLVSKDTTPEIWDLLERSLTTTDQMRVAPKAYYHRQRPFERFNDHLLDPSEEDILRGEGSYPSGHTMRGWVAALLLAEINPAGADGIYARGWEYGESRVIQGAHWQSDVDASRLAASIGFSALHTSPEFLAQMARARKEFIRLSSRR